MPPVFVDPLARRILGPDGPRTIANFFVEGAAATARLRATLAVRSRAAEDAVAAAVERGVSQYVVLGAGLDTFAYRHDYPALRVFEVDHAATQAWKLSCLAEAGIAVPSSARHVGFDFETGDLIGALARSGFEPAQPAIFAMLGVVFYVERESLLKTFGAVAAGAPGSEIVFDYVPDLDGQPDWIRSIYGAVAERVAAEGEPWITYFKPERLVSDLRGLGFTEIADLDAADLTTRYLAGRTDGLGLTPLAHVIRARTG